MLMKLTPEVKKEWTRCCFLCHLRDRVNKHNNTCFWREKQIFEESLLIFLFRYLSLSPPSLSLSLFPLFHSLSPSPVLSLSHFFPSLLFFASLIHIFFYCQYFSQISLTYCPFPSLSFPFVSSFHFHLLVSYCFSLSLSLSLSFSLSLTLSLLLRLFFFHISLTLSPSNHTLSLTTTFSIVSHFLSKLSQSYCPFSLSLLLSLFFSLNLFPTFPIFWLPLSYFFHFSVCPQFSLSFCFSVLSLSLSPSLFSKLVLLSLFFPPDLISILKMLLT